MEFAGMGALIGGNIGFEKAINDSLETLFCIGNVLVNECIFFDFPRE